MSVLELTEEEICAIKIERDHADKEGSPLDIALISAIHKLQGAKTKAEFWRDHTEYPGIDGQTDCDVCYWKLPNDTRHKYTDEKWLEAARKELADTEDK